MTRSASARAASLPLAVSLALAALLGGCVTLISSLASLITFREYTKHNPGKAGKYLLLFSAFNFGFLLLLGALMTAVFYG